MTALDDAFQLAVNGVNGRDKTLPSITNKDQINFYSLFKQATIGDVNTTRPGAMDYAGKAKWDGWASFKGTSELSANQQYIDLAKAVNV